MPEETKCALHDRSIRNLEKVVFGNGKRGLLDTVNDVHTKQEIIASEMTSIKKIGWAMLSGIGVLILELLAAGIIGVVTLFAG